MWAYSNATKDLCFIASIFDQRNILLISPLATISPGNFAHPFGYWIVLLTQTLPPQRFPIVHHFAYVFVIFLSKYTHRIDLF